MHQVSGSSQRPGRVGDIIGELARTRQALRKAEQDMLKIAASIMKARDRVLTLLKKNMMSNRPEPL
jgi:hypothetical protein